VVIRAQALVVRYGEVTAVDRLDLAIRRGECFGLLGPNGAGKTTTVEVMEGLLSPTSGSIEVLGQRWGGRQDGALRARLGVALQETRLPELLTVAETVRLFRSFYPRGRSVDEVIGILDLEEKRRARVGKLSGGQRQRLALACALVSDPEILFLDEPTTGLDPQARLRIWKVIEEFAARGGTTLITTHYMDEAARLCPRVAVMDHGRLLAQGSPGELIAAHGGAREATLDDVFVHLTGRGLRDG
jgi:ABC-2 type transport system ATP-binding protein